MVAGQLPFQSSGSQELCRKILNGDFRLPGFISRNLGDLINGLLTVDPARRLTVCQVLSTYTCSGRDPLSADTLHTVIIQVQRHPWIRMHGSNAISDKLQSKQPSKGGPGLRVDASILQELHSLCHDNISVIGAVQRREHTYLTTCYHLLCKRKHQARHTAAGDALAEHPVHDSLSDEATGLRSLRVPRSRLACSAAADQGAPPAPQAARSRSPAVQDLASSEPSRPALRISAGPTQDYPLT
eukprot:scaffold2355_cov382-Prasinococcus_capsulatus_cf.AAC.6